MKHLKCKCGRIHLLPAKPVQLSTRGWPWRRKLRLVLAVLRGETVFFNEA